MKRALLVLLGIACITITSLIGFSLGNRETISYVRMAVTPSAWVSIPLPNGLKPEHFIDSNSPYANVVASNSQVYHHICFLDYKDWFRGEIKKTEAEVALRPGATYSG
jgi:hypothetical protein